MRWRYWAGRRDRLVLALIGVIVLGAGLSVMSTLSDSITGTITRTYEQTWRAPYDILVHMPLSGGAALPDITEPNVLTTLPAGISVAQLEAIRQVPGVQVAAPIAVVGHVRAGPTLLFPSKDLPYPGAGVYRIVAKLSSAGAATSETIVEDQFAVFPDRTTGKLPAWAPAGAFAIDGKPATGLYISAQGPTLLVGLDPEAEASLVGLDKALIKGRYLEAQETLPNSQDLDGNVRVLPMLVNQNGFANLAYSLTIEELNPDLSVKRLVHAQSWNGTELAAVMQQGQDIGFHKILGTSGQLEYANQASPFPYRWSVAVSLRPTQAEPGPAFQYQGPLALHTATSLGYSFRSWAEPAADTLFKYRIVGLFDSSLLSLGKLPGAELPLMTYQPAKALHVLDAAGRPVNPPRAAAGGLSPVGFLSSPPLLVTTIPAALSVAGDHAINAVQIKVAGTEHFTPEAEARVREVSDEIRRSTGLATEVTMGSSPVNVLVRVPASGGLPDYGWVEEQWIHKNAAVTTVHQAEFGNSVYLAVVIVVAALYAIATGVAGVTARRREVGIAYAVGWPQAALQRLAMSEQWLFALVAGSLAALMGAASHVSPARVGLTLVAALVIYIPAVIATGYAAGRIPPGDALRWGDTAPGRRVLPGTGVLSLALSTLMGRPGRTLLTVVATALPTALLLILIYIGRHLNGVLYTTLTGQYAVVRVGGLQYVAGLVALGIAAVTAFDLIRQNAVDHRGERSLLHAVGWPRSWIARTMVAEGLLLGIASGLVGVLIGMPVLAALYGSTVVGVWREALLIALLPLGLGLLTSVISALVELRSWGRIGLAGVSQGQVVRFSLRTWLAGGVGVALVLGATAYLVLPQLAEQMKPPQDTGQKLADAAAAALAEAASQQQRALQSQDLHGYLATLDPAAEPYLMEQRHWLEDAFRSRREHPGAILSRTVSKVALIGTNTAHVRFIIAVGETNPRRYVVDTVWLQAADGRWVEHGLQQQTQFSGNITVSYPEMIAESVAHDTAEKAQQAAGFLTDTLGWGFDKPVVVELKEDRDALAASIGPSFAGIDFYFWYQYGEPVRLPAQGVGPPLSFVLRGLAYKSVIEKSHGHAAEWLVEGLTRYALNKRDPTLLQRYLSTGVTLVPPDRLVQLHPGYTFPAEFESAGNTIWFMALYMEGRYGAGAVGGILERLATEPVDLRGAGPDNYAERDKMTIAAIEQVTGKAWPDLYQEFATWFGQGIAPASSGR